MNERLPRLIRKIFTLENCVCETCTTGNKGNCVGGRIFILRSYCEVYRKFTRVLIVEIIFQQDGIDRRGDWNGKLKKLRGGRIFILRSVIRDLCKFGKINCWNYFSTLRLIEDGDRKTEELRGRSLGLCKFINALIVEIIFKQVEEESKWKTKKLRGRRILFLLQDR